MSNGIKGRGVPKRRTAVQAALFVNILAEYY